MASSARQPGARRLSEVRRRILSRRVACAFGEPQESSALLRSVVKGTPARTGVLDPLGVDLPAGPDAYFGLMRAIATSLVDCLSERN
jgi:zinc transport system substrate-binding protein